jgi:hypothetical protein
LFNTEQQMRCQHLCDNARTAQAEKRSDWIQEEPSDALNPKFDRMQADLSRFYMILHTHNSKLEVQDTQA